MPTGYDFIRETLGRGRLAMADKLLERLFSLDTRKEIYPGLQNPALRILIADERNDSIYAVIDHWLDSFLISTFPKMVRPFHAVYLDDAALDPSSGILVLGGESYSGNEPLKVYDTSINQPLWFASHVSREFLDRAPRLAGRIERGGDVRVVPTRAHAVTLVGIAPRAEFIVAYERLEKNSALRKYARDGNLLAELPDDVAHAAAMAVAPDGLGVLIAFGRELSWVDAATWSATSNQTVASAQLTKVAVSSDGMQVVAISEEGEVIGLTRDLRPVWRLELDAIPRSVRYLPGSSRYLIVGTNLGDLLLINEAGAVAEHERVSESVRDIAFLHGGRHIAVGCKNMDIHIFVNGLHPGHEDNAEWERRLRSGDTTVYTSTSSLTHARVFISYASADRDFAKRLEGWLSGEGIVCWRDEHSLTAGRITKQLSRAIMKNDIVLLVLSRASLTSDWVRWEVASAREAEKSKGRDVICPIAINSYWRDWDDDPVLKREITKYHILPFAMTSDDGKFEERMSQLVSGLRQNYLSQNTG